jgi:uncharacterized protein YjbI with pentapeptide repeats
MQSISKLQNWNGEYTTREKLEFVGVGGPVRQTCHYSSASNSSHVIKTAPPLRNLLEGVKRGIVQNIAFKGGTFDRKHINTIDDVVCERVRFDGARFRGCDIKGLHATECSFQGVDFTSANFSTPLESVYQISTNVFKSCNLQDATFLDCKFVPGQSTVVFVGCDLRGVKWDFKLADMSAIVFTKCCFSPDALPWLVSREDWQETQECNVLDTRPRTSQLTECR